MARKFAKPLSRLRECVDIFRLGLGGEKLQYDGEHYTLLDPVARANPYVYPNHPDLTCPST